MGHTLATFQHGVTVHYAVQYKTHTWLYTMILTTQKTPALKVRLPSLSGQYEPRSLGCHQHWMIRIQMLSRETAVSPAGLLLPVNGIRLRIVGQSLYSCSAPRVGNPESFSYLPRDRSCYLKL